MNFQFKINPNFDFNKLIPTYRNQIDNIDSEIIQLLEKRNIVCKKIGQCKKNMNNSIENKDREFDILINLSEKINNISNAELIKIYREIFVMSKRIQKECGNFKI